MWDWLSGPVVVLAVAVVQVVCGLFILAPGAAFPASAVRFLSVLGLALGVATTLRLASGPRFVGVSWLVGLERLGLLDRVPVPWWDTELPAAWLKERDGGWPLHRAALLGFAVGVPVVVTVLLTFTQAGLPRDVATLELVEGQTAEYLEDAAGQRRRLQGRLRLDELVEADGAMTAVLTGSDLSGTNERQTRLVEGERVALGDWTVQLSAVSPSSTVGRVEVRVDGQPRELRAGEPVEIGGVSVEFREGRFSFLGQLGPAALIRQTGPDGVVVEEWVFLRAPQLHGALGSGPLAVELVAVVPGSSVELTALSRPAAARGLWLLGSLVLAGLAGVMLLLGGRWVMGRDGDYTLVVWGAPSARRRQRSEFVKLLGRNDVVAAPVRRQDALSRLWWLGPLVLSLVLAGLGPASWASPMLWMVGASLAHVMIARDSRKELSVLLAAAVCLSVSLALTSTGSDATERAWLLHSLAMGLMSLSLVQAWVVSSRGGVNRLVPSVLFMLAAVPLTWWTAPQVFSLQDPSGIVSRELATWATSESLVILQTPGTLAIGAWPVVAAVTLLALGTLAVLIGNVVALRTMAAAAAVAAAGSAIWFSGRLGVGPTTLQGAPAEAGMQLVEHFRNHAPDAVLGAPGAAFVACAGLAAVLASLPGPGEGPAESVGAGAWSGVLWLTAASTVLLGVRHEALGGWHADSSPAMGLLVLFSGLLLLAAGARLMERDRLAGAILAVAVSVGLQGMIVP